MYSLINFKSEQKFLTLFLFCFLLIFSSKLFGYELNTSFRLVSNTHNSSQGTLVFELWGSSYGSTFTLVQEKCYLDAVFRPHVVSVNFDNHFYSSSLYNITEDYNSSTGRIRFIYSWKGGGMQALNTKCLVRITIVYNLADASSSITLGSKTDDPVSKWQFMSGQWGYVDNRSVEEELQSIPLCDPPTVTTSSVSNIAFSSASSGGTVTDNFGTVTARGVCWSTLENPTNSGNHTSEGGGIGSFISQLTNLGGGTLYYVRAFAANGAGTSYGNQVSFTTRGAVISTNAVSNIGAQTATGGGNVTSDDGSTVSATGVCWSTSENPTSSNSHTTNGGGTGTFTSSITGLSPTTTYYVRAYATNSLGTSYGSQVSFTTTDGKPTVTTNAITNISVTTATAGGNVTDEGSSSVSERGICWNTSANPTTGNNKIADAIGGAGEFTTSITGLNHSTTYYVRAYAINLWGTSYGDQRSFTTLSGNPSVTTSSVTNITYSSASCGGNVTNEGGAEVNAKGICWSTSENPTTVNDHTTDGSGTGEFTSSISGLAEGTVYHVRAYATNSYNTSYGDDVSFITLSTSPGTALNFDGSGYVNIPDNDVLDFTNSGSYTIEAWIKPETFGALRGIVSKYQNGGANGYFLRLSNTGTYHGLTIDGWRTEENILSANQWYHVAAVNNGGTRHLYLNGVEQTLTSEDPCTVQPNNDPVRIASDFGGRYFDGSIDEVRIWNVARTVDEIRENMYKTLDNTGSGLVCYWQFNDGSHSGTLRDLTNNQLKGTLTNMDVNNVWVNSTIPIGGGTSNTQNTFTSGTANLGNVRLTAAEGENAFDNAVDLVCTEINRSPNTTSGITGNVLNKYYVLKAYGTPGTFSANLTFTLPEGSISEADQSTPSNLKLYKRENNADGDWSLVTSASEATSTTATFTGITSFSQFIIASESSPLPVELTLFTAKQEKSGGSCGNAIKLEWQTATEVNNYGFEVERRSPSPTPSPREGASEAPLWGVWGAVGFVEGAGNSNSPKEYSFVDYDPVGTRLPAVDNNYKGSQAGLSVQPTTYGVFLQYRLKQIDTDGKFTYSNEVEVNIKFIPTEFTLEQNYPNPFNPSTTIKFGLPAAGKVQVEVYNTLGERVAELVNEMKDAGYYEVQWNADNLASGIYFYSIHAKADNYSKDFRQVKKMLLVK